MTTEGIDWQEPRWIVVYSRPQSEGWAYTNLLAQGYDAFLPMAGERNTDRLRPLFKRYLFCDIEGRSLAAVRGTYGVCRVLSKSDGYQPATVPTGLIRALRREHERGIILDAPVVDRPGKGDMLRIIEGSATGLQGRVIELRHGEVRLKLDMQAQTCALWVATDKCGAVPGLDERDRGVR